MSEFNFQRGMRFGQSNRPIMLDDIQPPMRDEVAEALDARYAPMPATGVNPLTGMYHARGYAESPEAWAEDIGPAVNAAIADAVANGDGCKVWLEGGELNLETVINLSNVNPSWAPYTGGAVHLVGAGHQSTRITGGETGYGFLELVGSMRVILDGISFIGNKALQYGILGGRKAGDSSSAGHVFRDVYVYGSFTLAGVFMLSAESCTYDQCIVYTTAGPATVLARDTRGWTVTAKHTAVSTSNPLNNGNGVITVNRCMFVTIRTPAGGGSNDSPFVLEYAQTFKADGLYVLSSGAPLVLLDKGCHQATFLGMHQEWNTSIPGAVEPYGVYAKDTTTGSEAKVVRLSIEDSSLYPIYGEDNQKFSQLRVQGSGWRSSVDKDYMVDVYSADEVELPLSYTPIGSHETTAPAYRARTGALVSTFAPVFTPEMFGAEGDGVTDDTDAVVAAFAAATSQRTAVIGGNVFEPRATVRLRGKYKLTTLAATMVACCNIDGAEGALIAPAAFASSVLLVGHETSGNLLQGASVTLPRITKSGATSLPAGSVGVKIQNLHDSNVFGRRIDYFETAWHITGLGQGTVYNRINLGRVDLCKVAHKLAPGVGGWVNSNTFTGGGVTQSPNTLDGTGIRRSGWRHLVIDGSAGAGTVNSNTFDAISYEGDLSEFTFDIKHASDNIWHGATRFEQGTVARAVSLASDTFTDAGHGLAVGDMVCFTALTAMPGRMKRVEAYYVSAVPSADTFKVAETRGGASYTFASSGTDVVYYVPPRIKIDGTGGNTYSNSIRPGYFAWPGPLDVREINAAHTNPIGASLPRRESVMPGRNRIINGDFRINQRGYLSAAAIGVGVFGFDRWKSNQAGTTLTFTSAPQGQLVLLSGYVQQVIERAEIPAGTYTLSWSGNALARVYNSGGVAPATVAGPITVDLDGTADVIVEFYGSSSTLGRVQLELGTVATAFEQESIASQLAKCKRYFQRMGGGSGLREFLGTGVANSSTSAFILLRLQPEMRTTPTVAITSNSTFRVHTGAAAIAHSGNPSLDATSNARSLRVNASVAAGLTAGQAATLDTGDGYFDLSAEL